MTTTNPDPVATDADAVTSSAPPTPDELTFTVERQPATRARRAAIVQRWSDGVEIRRYADGQIKVGRWDARLALDDLRNHGVGASRASGHVMLHFEPTP